MPSYAELAQEPWWVAEYQPPTVRTLCERLRGHYHVGAVAIGSKGDNNHLRGYHRSRNWIKNSRYCTNTTYSVSRTPGDRSGGDGDWLCAIDATIPHDELLAACKRLDEAVRAGLLEKVTEWYGNDDGDNRVDGYDNIANRIATSDPSHLWHLHISLDRGRAGEDHSDLFDILTGDTMTPEQFLAIMNDPKVAALWKARTVQYPVEPDKSLLTMYNQWDAILKKLAAAPPGGGGVSEDRIRELIREELDKTRLTG